jgi:hypothetical protein
LLSQIAEKQADRASRRPPRNTVTELHGVGNGITTIARGMVPLERDEFTSAHIRLA